MKPLVKYQGGKSRELKTITKMMPKEFNRVVEPFCGGAAVAFSVGKPAVLCDTNFDIINVYKCMGDQQGLRRICNHVSEMKLKGHDELEEMYYDARYIINQPIHETDPTDWSRALCYITLRQLCFSGMERYNAMVSSMYHSVTIRSLRVI